MRSLLIFLLLITSCTANAQLGSIITDINSFLANPKVPLTIANQKTLVWEDSGFSYINTNIATKAYSDSAVGAVGVRDSIRLADSVLAVRALIAASGGVTSVSGTANRITSSGGSTPVIDIASNYNGQTTINNVGTLTAGTWHATAVQANFGGTGLTTYTSGDMLYSTGTGPVLTRLSIGTTKQKLSIVSGIPTWVTDVDTGTVFSVTAGAGLSGGIITGSGTISMPNVGTAGTYGSATQTPVITTDAFGRVSGVTNTTITPAFSSITGTPTTVSGYSITDAWKVGGNTGSATPAIIGTLDSVAVVTKVRYKRDSIPVIGPRVFYSDSASGSEITAQFVGQRGTSTRTATQINIMHGNGGALSVDFFGLMFGGTTNGFSGSGSNFGLSGFNTFKLATSNTVAMQTLGASAISAAGSGKVFTFNDGQNNTGSAVKITFGTHQFFNLNAGNGNDSVKMDSAANYCLLCDNTQLNQGSSATGWFATVTNFGMGIKNGPNYRFTYSANSFGWQTYAAGTAPSYFNGDVTIGSNTDNGSKLHVTGNSQFSGNVTIDLGGTLKITEGTNGNAGAVTLVAGVGTISNTNVTANTRVYPVVKTSAGTLGVHYNYTVTAGVGVTITSISAPGVTQTGDVSTITYLITNS